MNNTTTPQFNPIHYAKKMTAIGFTQQQAEGQAEALIQIIDNNLATKTDIFLIQRDIKQIESNLKRDIEDSRLASKNDIALIQRDIKELELNLKRDIEDSRLASKNDIALIQRDIAELRKETKQDIALLSKVVEERTKALIWIGGVIAFIVGSSQVLKLLGF